MEHAICAAAAKSERVTHVVLHCDCQRYSRQGIRMRQYHSVFPVMLSLFLPPVRDVPLAAPPKNEPVELKPSVRAASQ